MSRPWEYPRWRRVAMQALMWVIFAGSLGLAQWITYQRAHVRVALAAPVNVDGLRVRLPEDWERTADWAPKNGVLDVVDSDHSREVEVTVSHFNPANDNSDDDTEDQLPSRGVEQITFAGLNQTGMMAVVRRIAKASDGSEVRQNSLVAVALLPNERAVKIELATADERIGPADRALVQQIANAITPRPPKAAGSQPAGR